MVSKRSKKKPLKNYFKKPLKNSKHKEPPPKSGGGGEGGGVKTNWTPSGRKPSL